MSPHSRAGVTFMEIISALAIIAVVAAIIFPVFQKVREPHHGTCHSNLSQLGLALTQYTQDYDESFPAGATPAGNGWAGELYPFVKSTGVYHCPDDIQDGAYISYAENQNLVRHSLNDLTAPAATVALYELTTLGCDPSASETNSATGLSAPQDSKRHDGGTPQTAYGLNFALTDGHVKYLTPGQVSGGASTVRVKALPQGAFVETFAVR